MQQKSSFFHIAKKYGPKSVRNHSFLEILIEIVRNSEDYFYVTRKEALVLIQIPVLNGCVYCQEVDREERDPDDMDLLQISHKDLIGNDFPEKWQTFVISITS